MTLRSARPVPWWVWAGLAGGEAASFFLAAVSPPASIGATGVWFSGLMYAGWRQRQYRVMVADLRRGVVRAEVVQDRPGLTAGVRALPSGRR